METFWGEKYSWLCEKNSDPDVGLRNYNKLQDFISPVIDN